MAINRLKGGRQKLRTAVAPKKAPRVAVQPDKVPDLLTGVVGLTGLESVHIGRDRLHKAHQETCRRAFGRHACLAHFAQDPVVSAAIGHQALFAFSGLIRASRVAKSARRILKGDYAAFWPKSGLVVRGPTSFA